MGRGTAGAIRQYSPVSVDANAIFELAGCSVSIPSLSNGPTGGGVVDNYSTNTITITVGSDNTNTTFSGVIQNGLSTTSLVKTGSGTLTLAGTNTYTGTTTVSTGTLQLGDGSTHNGSLAGNIADNAAVTFANPGWQSYSGVISGSGSLTKIGSGALVLTANNTITGITTISTGTLQLGDGSGQYGSVGGNIYDNAALVFDNAYGLTYAGWISGSGTLSKTGAGMLTLSGTNSYGGVTGINTGTLQAGSPGSAARIHRVAVQLRRHPRSEQLQPGSRRPLGRCIEPDHQQRQQPARHQRSHLDGRRSGHLQRQRLLWPDPRRGQRRQGRTHDR